jgi:PAS domain S-box-containing protein
VGISTEAYRRIIEAVPEGVWVVDPEGRTIFSNQRMAEILGVDYQSMPHQSCFDCVFPDELEDAQRHFARTLAGDRRPFDFRLRRADGSPIWVSISCMLVSDDAGAPAGLLGLFTDIAERKAAEAALRESEERFRNMADTAPVMIWVSDRDKLGTYFNKAWLDFTGRAIEQELGNGWMEGVHPEDLKHCLAVRGASFDAHNSFQVGFRLRRPDGEYRWILDTGVPRYRHGEFTGFIGSCSDVTELKLVEQRLRANEVQLKEAQRLAKVGSWGRSSDGAENKWSDEMLRILGLTTGPPDFQTFLSLVHPNDRERVADANSKAMSGFGPVDVEYRVTRQDGEVRFVRSLGEGVRNEEGAIVGIVGATQDVTEQVAARELLRESERWLKNAERLAHVGHWAWDLRLNRVSGSEEMYRIFGKQPDFVPSYDGFLEDLQPADRQRIQELIQDSLVSKVGHSLEYQIAHPNGDLRTIFCIWEVMLDEGGSPVRIFGTCQDITARKRSEEMLRQSELQLRALAGSLITAQDDERRRISRELHDDITQQLAFLSIELGKLTAKIPNSLEVHARVRTLQERAQEMAAGVRRLSHGLHPSVIEDLGLSATLQDFCTEFSSNRGIDVQFSGLVDKSTLDTAAATCLYRVAQESLRNSVVHGHATAIRVNLTSEDGSIHLRIRDNGVGFDPEDGRTRTGLGLINMRERVRLVNGRLTISSRPGYGTEIGASVPLG